MKIFNTLTSVVKYVSALVHQISLLRWLLVVKKKIIDRFWLKSSQSCVATGAEVNISNKSNAASDKQKIYKLNVITWIVQCYYPYTLL